MEVAALRKVAALQLALDETAQECPITTRQAPRVVIQVERVAIKTTLQESADLFSDPLDSRDHTQSNEAWPSRGDLNVPRDADI